MTSFARLLACDPIDPMETPLMSYSLRAGRLLVAVWICAAFVALSMAGSAQAASPNWRVIAITGPTHLPPSDQPGPDGPGTGLVQVYATNVGGEDASGTVTIDVGPLPAGITTSASAAGNGWSCSPAGAGHSSVSCTSSAPVPPGFSAAAVRVPVQVGPSAPAVSSVEVSVQGGGAAPDLAGGDSYTLPLRVSSEPAEAGVDAFWAGAFDEDGRPATQAGGHPARAVALFFSNTAFSPGAGPVRNQPGAGVNALGVVPVGDLRQIDVALPAGFVGNPLVTPRCPQRKPEACSPNAQVGAIYPQIIGATEDFATKYSDFGRGFLYNAAPPSGYPGQFTFTYDTTRATVVPALRKDDYGVTAISPNIPQFVRVSAAHSVLEGSPAGAGGNAFLTNPTDCSGMAVITSITASTWQNPTLFSSPLGSLSPAITGCELVPFDPSTSVTATSPAPDAASGLEFDLTLPQDGLLDPNEVATSHLKDVVVDLPEGMAVNPSAATGLAGCSDAEIGIASKAPPACPDGSKLGTVRITSPLLEEVVDGTMYLGTPTSIDPASGQMLRLFVVARNDERGIMVKVPGSATADPATGKLTATFENNPRLPFDHLTVKLRGGQRGLLATPQLCGTRSITSTLSPWSGNAPATQSTATNVTGDCSFGFAPKLDAGMSSGRARGTGVFSFKFSRQDGEQWVDSLVADLPPGLLASVKNVPLCTDAQAAAGACPVASRIGTVDATAGSGTPFVLEQKGSAYLTEGYKGCAYGLLVNVPVIAGPFRGDVQLSDVNVRQAVCVDRKDAHVTAISDPLPLIHHGVPLRVREVTVLVDRPGFMLNPSDCSTKRVNATIASAEGSAASPSAPFQASGCAALPFKPKLALALTGRKQTTTGKHPGVKAKVTQAGVSEAGIEKTVVRLPRSLALDPDNAQALCEFADGTKPDIEDHCPKGSIVGRARAVTPLLEQPLSGNVYFVKNVRTDPKTGNQIRTLPMIIVALRGEIAVNLKGESSTTRSGKLVNTFDRIPDAPISQFNLNIKGGKRGILAVTRTARSKINLCTGRHIAEADIDGHNGRRADQDIRMKTPCPKGAKRGRKSKRSPSRR
jgi:hypothetical protein